MYQPAVAVYLITLPSIVTWCRVTEEAGTASFASAAGLAFSAGSVAVSSLLQAVTGATESKAARARVAIEPRISNS